VEGARILPPGRVATDRSSQAAKEIVETVVLTLLIFFAVHFSVQPFIVDGPSMQPGLHTGDLVVVNLLTYDFSAPQRGDVIVFHPPNNPGLQYVKRIIGIPGDVISITPNAVLVNGHQLSEPYIYPLAPGENESPVAIPYVKLGPGQYFVLGDNRLDSTDSRFFKTPVTRQMIIGKVQAVVWPLNAIEWLPDESSVFAAVGHH
jgi:signal peptidase I